MKHLIVGGAGQDGTLLAAQLLAQGQEVHSYSRRPGLLQGVTYITGDVTKEDELECCVEALAPDKIYYFAAHHTSSEANHNDNVLLSLEVNVRAFVRLLDTIVNNKIKADIVYASSCRIFGYGDGSLLTEYDKYAPQCIYSTTKAAATQIAKHYRENKDVNVSSAILFNHESELRNPSFVSKKIVLGAIKSRKEPNTKIQVMSLNDLVDWGSARDYVAAIKAISYSNLPDDYIIGSGELYSVREFAQLAFGSLGLNWQDHIIESAPQLTSKWQLRGSSQKLKDKIGWQPYHNFESMVQDMLQRTEFYDKQKPVLFQFYL